MGDNKLHRSDITIRADADLRVYKVLNRPAHYPRRRSRAMPPIANRLIIVGSGIAMILPVEGGQPALMPAIPILSKGVEAHRVDPEGQPIIGHTGIADSPVEIGDRSTLVIRHVVDIMPSHGSQIGHFHQHVWNCRIVRRAIRSNARRVIREGELGRDQFVGREYSNWFTQLVYRSLDGQRILGSIHTIDMEGHCESRRNQEHQYNTRHQ